jgi:ABC-type polysaccharide/polyol phosphate export permease
MTANEQAIRTGIRDSRHVLLTVRTFRNLRKCVTWAWLDTVCQYRRSKLGPLWETINVLVTILGITAVSAAVIGGEFIDLLGYAGIGIIIWTAISSFILEGAQTFIRNRDHILASNISIDIYVGRTVFKVMINFLHHSVLYFLGLALTIVPLTWTSLLAIPGLILLFVNSYWIVAFLGFVCVRFRDVEQIVRNLLQLAFFITPVFWRFEQIPLDRRFIVDLNLLYYFIEIVRAPLLGQIPPTRDYIVVILTAVVGYGLTFLVYRRMRRRLAFYV